MGIVTHSVLILIVFLNNSTPPPKPSILYAADFAAFNASACAFSLSNLATLHSMPLLLSNHNNGAIAAQTNPTKVKHHPLPIALIILSIAAVPPAPIKHLTKLLHAVAELGLAG
jgi:hypothetical protein